MRSHQGLDPMKGLTVKRVIAAGQSQSADKLYGYVTQWQDQANVIDGFLIHGNGTVRKTFPAPLSVPVLNLLSDREAEPEEPTDGPELPAVGGRRHGALGLLHRPPVGVRQRARGSPASPPWTAPATPRSSTRPATTGRSSTRELAACVVAGADHADALRHQRRPAPARPLGPDRQAPGAHAALRVRRRRAGQGRARQPARRHPDATDRGAGGDATRARCASSAASPSRSATPRSRGSTRASTPTSGSWRRRPTGRYAAAGCSRRTRAT